MVLSNWPSIVDDSGNGTSGTIVNKANVWDVIKASIDAAIFSATNPTVTAAQIIDEVVTARGGQASLDARLDLIEAGGITLPSTGASQTQVKSALASLNIVVNGDMYYWPDGGSLAPLGWTLTGAGAGITRTGLGMGDTFSFGNWYYASKLTYGAATLKLTQTIFSATDITTITDIKGRTLSFGCYIKTSVASQARIVVDDGISTTASAYHSGSGNAEWITVSRSINNGATKVEIYLELGVGGSAYFGAVTGVIADLAPSKWQLSDGQRLGFRPQASFVPGSRISTTMLMSGLYQFGTTPVTQSSASELDLITGGCTIYGKSLFLDGQAVRVQASFVNNGGVGNRTLRFYLGSSSHTVLTLATASARFSVEVWIVRTGSAAQKVITIATINGTNPSVVQSTWAENLSNDLAFKFTTQGAGAGDGMTQDFFRANLE